MRGTRIDSAVKSLTESNDKVNRKTGGRETKNVGRTLYANANDAKDTSTCSGNCAQNWPAFIAPQTPQAPGNLNAALLTIFKRPDGNQVEYDGHPLYYFAGDKNPGDVKGQDVGNVWHVLSPRGNPMLNAYAPAPTRTP